MGTSRARATVRSPCSSGWRLPDSISPAPAESASPRSRWRRWRRPRASLTLRAMTAATSSRSPTTTTSLASSKAGSPGGSTVRKPTIRSESGLLSLGFLAISPGFQKTPSTRRSRVESSTAARRRAWRTPAWAPPASSCDTPEDPMRRPGPLIASPSDSSVIPAAFRRSQMLDPRRTNAGLPAPVSGSASPGSVAIRPSSSIWACSDSASISIPIPPSAGGQGSVHPPPSHPLGELRRRHWRLAVGDVDPDLP